ncbi:class I adenylate-forming enzyme family protein [Thalassococcus sp. S3]|uniref:class I adenylate-forming enzyme family protein n=1 Tax=Thalassococcus sp. S3 TaxID=2017482 RepID=UPI0010246DE4|nr:class I adenylate-forming enzyme family protein [Thalassococcus sp. S3]QBF29668.1 long-chain fatty acid--CoA ligase [Thalassococcus sp. S3]
MHATRTLLTHLLSHAAARAPQSPAIADDDLALTYGELADAAARIAAHLAEIGVQPGDRVILSMPNSTAFCAAFWGIVSAGAVAVPLNPGTKCAKLAFVLGNCRPAAVLADDVTAQTVRAAMAEAGQSLPVVETGRDAAPGLLDQLIAPQASAPDLKVPAVIDQDLATIIYTSGSTGEPKGVMLSHLNMTSAARSVAQYLGYRSDDHIFCAVPMTFDYGLHQLTMAALTGASVQAEPSFAQPFFALKRMQDCGATVFPLVPTMVPLIAPLADRFDLSGLRLVSSTAAALHAEVIDQLQEMLPQATVFSMYGLTECHRCTYLPPDQLASRKTSVGLAIPNTEMWVVDEAGQRHRHSATGELVIRGSTVMKGYWQNPEATARRLRPGPFPGEQVLYTGDTCRLDEDGYLYFVGRSDDILKIGGEKVAPSEVEAVLVAHPDVREVCVLGEDHPVHGQICVAYVAATVDTDTLSAWCRARLDPHAVPARIVVHADLPRTQNGKIDRAALRAGPVLEPAE